MAERYGKIIIPRYGGPEVLEIGYAELREPRAGEVRVKMLAAGVSWVESMLGHGAYPGQPKPPLTPGYDLVGIVDRGGEGTTRFKAGDTVAALMALGTHAEYVYVAEEELVPVPAGLDPGEEDAAPGRDDVAAQQRRGAINPAARGRSRGRFITCGTVGPREGGARAALPGSRARRCRRQGRSESKLFC
jgi:hypothetical protein